MTILFTGKVYCSYCKGRHKTKLQRRNRIYCCASYDKNLGCEYRNMVSQQQLLELLEMRFKRILTKEEIDLLVDHIIVKDGNIEIFLKEDKPIRLMEKFAEF